MTNVYLASGFRQRNELRKLAIMLEEKNITTCSSWIWIDKRPDRTDQDWNQFAPKIAIKNLADLLSADILVLDTNGIAPDNNGGCHFETGFMLAREKPIYIIGQRGNTFHWLLEDEDIFNNYEELIEKIQA
jgi:nucleoside 2-deoxyribosyltransferase